MKSRKVIKKSFAALSILVWLLAIAPKQLMHDALTSHKHQFATPAAEEVLNEAGFVCDCAHLVAKSPFVDVTDPPNVTSQPEYAVFVPSFGKVFQPIPLQNFRLRGPPALV